MFLEKEACDANQTVKYSTSVTNSIPMIILEEVTLNMSYFHEQGGKHPVLGLPSTWTLGIQPNPPPNSLIPEKFAWSGVVYYTVYKSNHRHRLPLIRPQLFFYIYSTYSTYPNLFFHGDHVGRGLCFWVVMTCHEPQACLQEGQLQ